MVDEVRKRPQAKKALNAAQEECDAIIFDSCCRLLSVWWGFCCFSFFSQVHKSNLSAGVMNGASLLLESGVGSPSPLQDTSCCRSVMQTQLCPEGLWGGERPQPDLSVCEIRIDLQGLIWKAKLCTSFCMLRIISRFTITVSILAPGPWHEESCSPQVSLKLWGVLPSTLRGGLGDHRLLV